MDLRWHRVDGLSARQLYDLLAFRQATLIVEQASPYPDLDGRDLVAEHLVARDAPDGAIIGCLRSYGPEDVPGKPASFGRLVVAPAARARGLGRTLVAAALQRLAERHPGADVVIGAQAHLQKFYGSFGFITESEPYDDGGILHVDMRLRRAARRRVLLADDETVNQIMTAALLRRQGHAVAVVDDGTAAVDAVVSAETAFDLVLMDLRMPGMDGAEAVRRIRALPDAARAATPIAMLTASTVPGDAERSRDAGADAVLAKPFTWEALRTLLDSAPPPAAAAVAEAPADAFSEEAIRQMREILPAERVAGLLDTARRALAEHRDALAAAHAEGNRDRASLLAHKIAGVAGVYGCMALRAAAQALERAIERGDRDMAGLFVALDAAAAPALAFLERQRAV